MKPSLCKLAIKHAMLANVNICMFGAPGGGKTQVGKQAAKEIDHDVFFSHPAISDPTDYKGMPWIANGEATFVPFGDLKAMINAKKPTIVFIDDVGQAMGSVQAALMQLIEERRIDGNIISDKIRFVLASNRESDRAYVQKMITPLRNRIIGIEFDTDLDDWCEWALQNEIAIETVAFMRFRPGLLHDFQPDKNSGAFPSPRSWEYVSKLLATKMPVEIEYEMVKGSIGEGAAAEFLAFIKVYRSLPNIDGILLNPTTAQVPKATETSVLYAVTGALTHKATEANFGRVLQYGNRLPKEFCVCLVKDCVKKNPKITHIPDFTAWAIKNRDILL